MNGFSRRFDRQDISQTSLGAASLLKEFPDVLVKYHARVAKTLWLKCTALVGIVMGHYAQPFTRNI